MTIILGFVVVMGMVFGGYMLSGGDMGIITHALPFEGMMIGGAALGSFIAANSFANIAGAGRALVKAFKGPKWNSSDYVDLLNLMYTLARKYQQNGMLALDDHIENPQESAIFSQYPKLQKDHFAIDLITDSFRMLAMQFDDPYQAEDVINRKLKKHHHEALVAPHGLTTVSDALPAIGIVAAVLGVIKTMSSIDKPPAVLGAMIGGALVFPWGFPCLSFRLAGGQPSSSHRRSGRYLLCGDPRHLYRHPAWPLSGDLYRNRTW